MNHKKKSRRCRGLDLAISRFTNSLGWEHDHLCTDKKENKIFLIYKEIQMGAVVKSYMRRGLLIYIRKCANI